MAISITDKLAHYKGDPDPTNAKTKACVAAFVSFYKKLQDLHPRIDGRDRIWEFSFPTSQVRGNWLDVYFQEYAGVVYIVLANTVQIEFELKTKKFSQILLDYPAPHKTFLFVLKLCLKQIQLIKTDFVKYESQRLQKMPLAQKTGVIPRKLVWKLIPDLIRPELDLNKKDRQILTQTFDQQYRLFREAEQLEMTVNRYLSYCKVAYDAVMTLKENRHKSFDKNTTGREYYKSLSDGRYSHLLDIDGDDPAAFNDWYHNRGMSGDHPWEILRGGNTTHIDLGVSEIDIFQDKKMVKGWEVFLSAQSLGRMLESCKIATALYQAKLPFKWHSWKSVKLRVDGNDHIGVMPEHSSLHRGWQSFPEHLKVYDVLHLSDFGKKRAVAQRLIQWLPTESYILAPVGVSPMDRHEIESRE